MLQSEIDYFLAQAFEEDHLAAASTDPEAQQLHSGFATVFRKHGLCAQRDLLLEQVMTTCRDERSASAKVYDGNVAAAGIVRDAAETMQLSPDRDHHV